MIPKPFDQVRKEDVDDLVTNGVAEGRTIEYKATLPGPKDDGRKEFLKDVSAFANAFGGDLLYGVVGKTDEKGKTTGEPDHVPGLPDFNQDQVIGQLENLIRDGIAPRILGVKMRPVGGFDRGPVLLLRIPRSYASPHMVTFRGSSKFYLRNSGGVHQMDHGEIRAAFASSESLPERVRQFRAGRLELIASDATPIPLRRGPTLVLHVLPLAALDGGSGVDITRYEMTACPVYPMGADSWDDRFNLDGRFLHRTSPTTRACESYVQIFRSGAVESVNAALVEPDVQKKLLPIDSIEYQVVQQLERSLRFQHEGGVEPPTVVMMSLLNVRDWAIPRDVPSLRVIDRARVLLPEVILDSYAADVRTVLRPAFDALWQASGWPRCPHYDDTGVFALGRRV